MTKRPAKVTGTEKREPAHIGILAYPGAQLSAVHGLIDLFLTANRIDQERRPDALSPALCVSHWQTEPQTGRVEKIDCVPEECRDQLSALVLPPSLEDQGSEPLRPGIKHWIRRQYGGGAVACSICAGAFILGETGLLQDRSATTHWALKDRFAALFPDVRLKTDKLIVEDGDIITAGGVMAWIDLGLRIIDRFVGPTVMLEVARFFLVDPGGREQRFYSSFAPRLTHGDEAILNTQHWMQANFDGAATIASMASVAGLSERTFLRRFKKATGLKPTAYMQALRVGKARELLELSSVPFNQIAWQVGYEDPAAFSKVFQRVMGLSPGEYRRRFAVRP